MEDASGEKPPAELLEVTIGDWPGLGGDVRLELGGQRTVLVGKNGTGKSLILAGFARAAREAWLPGFLRLREAPQSFRCTVERAGESPIHFEYRWRLSDAEPEFEESVLGLESAEDERAAGSPRVWSERCWRGDGTFVWKVEGGEVTVGEAAPVVIGSGFGLLSTSSKRAERHLPDGLPPEREALLRVLTASVVPAGVPRSEEAQRGEVLLRVRGRSKQSGRRLWGALSMGRVEALARRLATVWEAHRPSYEEFEALARRLGLVREGVRLKVYEDPQDDLRPAARRDIADILFDGVNIGLLSDGTLRTAEILIELVQPQGHLLLIEEPETGVHPGLLSKLLAELEAYTVDRQLVVSTHSARVVDWCERQPRAVRLVEREANRTTIRSLTPEEAGRVASYLNDEGTLGEFVYHQVGQ